MIKTQKINTRYPGIAFLLSLVCTGLGQVYNGDMVKGIVFGLLRCMPLFLIPLAVLKEMSVSYINTFMVMIFICLTIIIAAPCEALWRARRSREMPQKAYNSITGYGIFVLINAFITALSIVLLISFFSIERVLDKNPGPMIDSGDYVLVKRFASSGYARGDLVLYEHGSVARIIALEGDSVRYAGNIFYINGRALILGYLADRVIQRFASDWEDIISESSDGKRYPIVFKTSAAIYLQHLDAKVKKKHILVASDRRIEKNFARSVPVDRVQGRVEGIFFSSNIRKIMMDSWAGLR
jgi:signal peptidase I